MHATMVKKSLPEELEGAVCRASELKLRKQRMEKLSPIPSGIRHLDEILEGGWPRGALSEISGTVSTGRFATLLSTLRGCLIRRIPAALIDQGSHLDPRGAARLGLELKSLLWVRPESLNDSLACAEMILQAGFSLVALDLGLSPVVGHVSPAAWLRLARLSTEYQAVTLLGSPFRISGCAARLALHMRRERQQWIGTPGRIRLLGGIRNRIEILKSPQLLKGSITGFSAGLPEAEKIESMSLQHNNTMEVPCIRSRNS